MKQLGILMLRGSGSPGFKRQEKFTGKLFRMLNKAGVDTQAIALEYVNWYGPLEEQQEIILQRMFNTPGLRLRAKALRKLLISNIADLITYGGNPSRTSEAYKRTHDCLHNSLIALKNQLPEKAPLIIIASSMGTEIMNNYIWDRQQGYDDAALGNSAFERFESLVGYFTFGNNIPIFAASYKVDDLKPIEFPSKKLPASYESIAKWVNYYDKNDPLGYPVKFLNSHYSESNIEDTQVNAGGIFGFWNLFSHFGYWTSRRVRKSIASFIQKVMRIH